MALWHEAGFEEDPVVKLSNSNKWLRLAKISRHAKRCALKALEKEGLVKVERKKNASPIVTILPCPEDRQVGKRKPRP